MQPNNPQQDWQQPTEAPAQAPYQAPTVPSEPVQQPPISPQATAPVVMTDPSDVAEPQPSEQAEDENPDDEALLRWQAPEYQYQERSPLWYAVVVLSTIGLMAAAIFLMRAYTFAALLLVMAVALVVYVRRTPTMLNYTLTRKGLYVNDRLYGFDMFKSFAVHTVRDVHSAILVPRKRFQMAQTLFFPEEVGEPLVDMLASRLPMKEFHPDLIDRILMRLRF